MDERNLLLLCRVWCMRSDVPAPTSPAAVAKPARSEWALQRSDTSPATVVPTAPLGSFVPAGQARIGVVDKLFSRINASDDLAAGRSTFLVEMLGTAAILNQATEGSMVILDEGGRNTPTHDGLAIAQATMEHLLDVVGCRTLFATSPHELADATDAMQHAACMAMDASAGRHGDVFTFKVTQGRGSRMASGRPPWQACPEAC